MCGCEKSCLGVESEIIIEKLKSKMPARFKLADGEITLSGALFELDKDFRVRSVERIKESEL
jgi:calcineurin-like phosphoesterase